MCSERAPLAAGGRHVVPAGGTEGHRLLTGGLGTVLPAPQWAAMSADEESFAGAVARREQGRVRSTLHELLVLALRNLLHDHLRACTAIFTAAFGALVSAHPCSLALLCAFFGRRVNTALHLVLVATRQLLLNDDVTVVARFVAQFGARVLPGAASPHSVAAL